MAKRSYAVRACDYCDLEVPGNELFAIVDRVVSGTRQGSRSYFSTRGTVGRGSSSSTYYKMNHLKICGECYEQRAAAIRRQRLISFLGTCFALAIVIGVIAFVFASSHSSSFTASNTVDDAVETDIVADNSNVGASGNETSVAPAAAGADASDNEAIPADRPSDETQADDKPAQDDQGPSPAPPQYEPREDEYARAINRATPVALESGQPASWEAAGAKGYVVPSAPQPYGDEVCRNIYSTRIYGDHQSQSTSVRWCREGAAGDWHLAN